MSKEQTNQHFDSIVDFSGIEQFIDTQVKFYSSGMYIRLAFAVAVHVDPDVLLVDEVLAVGDEPFQRKCMDRIHSFQNDGRTIIIVSHNMDQIAEICDRAIVLEHGKLIVDGEPTIALRHLRADFEATREDERERERNRVGFQTATRASVRRVRITNAAGDPASVIKPGDDITVHVYIDATEPLSNWMLGVGVETPLGMMVYGTNTQLMGESMPTIVGEGHIEMRLPALWLGEGNYTVQATIAEASGLEVHRFTNAASFSVEADGRSVGYLYVAPELTVDTTHSGTDDTVRSPS